MTASSPEDPAASVSERRPARARDRRTSRGAPDPGTPGSARVALVVAIVLCAIAFGLQNIPPVLDVIDRATAARETAPPTDESSGANEAAPAVRPPDFGTPFALMGKLYIKLGDAVASDPSAMDAITRFAEGDADLVRAAIIEGELYGADAALARLADLAPTLEPGGPLASDAAALGVVYASGPDALGSDSRAQLEKHHGYFGEVALTFGLPDDHPDRADLLGGGVVLIAVFGAFGLLAITAFLAGCVLFLVGLILLATGKLRPRFEPPSPGGSVMLEVFCWFVGGFLLVSLGSEAVGMLVRRNDPTATWPAYIPLVAQWLLLLAPLWALVRGDTRRELAQRIGWNTGSGLFKEIGFGVLAYLAGLPLFIAGVLTTLGLMTLVEVLVGQENADPPTSPVIEMVAGGSPLALVLLFLLATIWAPLCEELVFRGALQRHLRSRSGPVLAALGASAVFGFMHGYGPVFVFPLIALGVVFSTMRELRGSLVPSITAHALHNGTVLIAVFALLSLVG